MDPENRFCYKTLTKTTSVQELNFEWIALKCNLKKIWGKLKCMSLGKIILNIFCKKQKTSLGLLIIAKKTFRWSQRTKTACLVGQLLAGLYDAVDGVVVLLLLLLLLAVGALQYQRLSGGGGATRCQTVRTCGVRLRKWQFSLLQCCGSGPG